MSDTVAQIVSVISSLPDWVSIQPSNWHKERARLNAAARRVARRLNDVDLDALRAGIEAYASASNGAAGLPVEAAGRLMLLNRLVFAVPEWGDGSVGFFGGFAGPRVAGGPTQIGWPVVTLPDGTAEIAHPFGGYFGDDFLASTEFDVFRGAFARRVWP